MAELKTSTEISTKKQPREQKRQERLNRYGNIIRMYRKAANLEHKDIGAKLGIHPNSISNWERGTARPDIDFIPGLCKVLNMPVEALFGLELPESELTERERKLIDKFRSLSEAMQDIEEQHINDLLEYEKNANSDKDDEFYLQNYFCIPFPEIVDAAGTGVTQDGTSKAKHIYVRACRDAANADEIHKVNGHSMEPEYPHGSLVYVKRTTEIGEGEIGIFLVDGATYIKMYTFDGLKSLNREYPLMRRSEYGEIKLIGKVLGPVDPDAVAKGNDLDMCIGAFNGK